MTNIKAKNGTFKIYADISGQGVELELFVIPDGTWYLVQLDGITLSKMEFIEQPVSHWHQIEGTLDSNVLDRVGKAIQNKVTAGLKKAK